MDLRKGAQRRPPKRFDELSFEPTQSRRPRSTRIPVAARPTFGPPPYTEYNPGLPPAAFPTLEKPVPEALSQGVAGQTHQDGVSHYMGDRNENAFGNTNTVCPDDLMNGGVINNETTGDLQYRESLWALSEVNPHWGMDWDSEEENDTDLQEIQVS